MTVFDDFFERCSDVYELAEGGQKKVYSANHDEFGPVVVKHGEFRSTGSLERISREVGLLRELESPSFPRLFEFLIEPVRREFLIVEELLNAQELRSVRYRFTSDASILLLLQQLAVALSGIWERNVVHRDLKPANILITRDGAPRIIDFGIARFLDDQSITATIAACGPATPIYAAPEQLKNRKAMINHRTDFFLLGIVVLELILGFHPHDPTHVGNDGSLIENIMNGEYVAPPNDRSEVLRHFIKSSLEPQPFKRFRKVSDLLHHLGVGDCR